MTAPHMANDSIRRHSPGPSARPDPVCCKASIAAKPEIRNSVAQQSSPPAPPELHRARRSFAFFAPFVATPASALLRGSASPRDPLVGAITLEIRDCVDQQSPRRVHLPFVSFVPFVVPPVSALLPVAAALRKSLPAAAKLEIRDRVDQQSSPVSPQAFPCARPTLVSFAPFVDAPVSAVLRVSASPRESFLAAAQLEIRDRVDQQSSPVSPQALRRVHLLFVSFVPFVVPPVHRQSAAQRDPSQPKKTFADPLTRYLLSSYGEKNRLLRRAAPQRRGHPFPQLVIP
jgi:hypothetical protein